MSELKDDLMKKIGEGEVKMRSKNFFIFAKAAIEVGLISLLILVIYLFNLSIYLPKRDLGFAPRSMMGPGSGLGRQALTLNVIPWHYLIFGIIALAMAFWLIYRYTGAYKKHVVWTLIVVAVVILLSSFVLSLSGVNERLENHRRLKGLYNRPGMMRDFRGQAVPGDNHYKILK
jgi:small-conductance mechanosensitive channel